MYPEGIHMRYHANPTQKGCGTERNLGSFEETVLTTATPCAPPPNSYPLTVYCYHDGPVADPDIRFYSNAYSCVVPTEWMWQKSLFLVNCKAFEQWLSDIIMHFHTFCLQIGTIYFHLRFTHNNFPWETETYIHNVKILKNSSLSFLHDQHNPCVYELSHSLML